MAENDPRVARYVSPGTGAAESGQQSHAYRETGRTDPTSADEVLIPEVISRDDFEDGEVLPDQNGADAVLTFTFASKVNLVLVRSVGATSRVDPFGTTPDASTGIIAADDEPTYIPIGTTAVKVYAPTGAAVAVAGFRRF